MRINVINFLFLLSVIMTYGCKKKVIVTDKLEFTSNIKDAYYNFEEITVTNTSSGYKDFEWYLDDVFISSSLVISKDKLQTASKNVKHALKLVGTNEQGIVETFSDSFIYRDLFKFKSVRFFNLRGNIFNPLDTNIWKPAISICDNSGTFNFPFRSNKPPIENNLISHVWTKDSFLINQNNFREPRSNDYLLFQRTSNENYISTKISNTATYSIYYSYLLKNNPAVTLGGIIGIKNVMLDSKSKLLNITTDEIDFQLKLVN